MVCLVFKFTAFAKLSDSVENLSVFLLSLEINVLGALITVWFPLNVLSPSGFSVSKPLINLFVICLVHSHSFLRMRKYVGNRAERRSQRFKGCYVAAFFTRVHPSHCSIEIEMCRIYRFSGLL